MSAHGWLDAVRADLRRATPGPWRTAAERQREIDNRDCPICGGDMLRRDYTASDRCHAQRWPEWRTK